MFCEILAIWIRYLEFETPEPRRHINPDSSFVQPHIYCLSINISHHTTQGIGVCLGQTSELNRWMDRQGL